MLGALALVWDVLQQLAAPSGASPQWWFALSCIGAGAIIARLERIARSLSAMAPSEPAKVTSGAEPAPAPILRHCPRCATAIERGWGMCPQCLTPQGGS